MYQCADTAEEISPRELWGTWLGIEEWFGLRFLIFFFFFDKVLHSLGCFQTYYRAGGWS